MNNLSGRALLLTSLFAIACSTIALAGKETPEQLVQRQVEAYNARNLDAFLATYGDDAQLFDFPDKPLARGTAQLGERYGARFADTSLHAKIVKRIALGNLVVDHERVTMRFPEGRGALDAIAIYQIENGRIAKVWFRRGEKKLDVAKPSTPIPAY